MQTTNDAHTGHNPNDAQTKTRVAMAMLRATTLFLGGEISMMVGASGPFTRQKPAFALLCVMNACADLCTREECEVASAEDLTYVLSIFREQTTVIDEVCSPEDATFAHEHARAAFVYVEQQARDALGASAGSGLCS